jgi:putative cardiolipin synthase
MGRFTSFRFLHPLIARAGAIGLLLPLLALMACSGLPAMPDRRPSTHVFDTADTALGRSVRAASPNDGRSGLRALSDPLEAFAARVLLVRAAERALDVQYYLWRPDITGTLLLKELDQAAERGVRVRLLLDDNGIAGLDPMLAALNARAQIEVRLFNPFPNRNFKALGYLTDFARLNQRMHNKALIADAQAAIVGGRNVGDAYFGADPALDFADMDVMVAGPIAAEVAGSFDAFWNSPLAYPLEVLLKPSPDAQAPLTARAAEIARLPDTTRYAQAVRKTDLAAQIESGALRLDWVPMRLISDPPGKVGGTADPSTWMATDLTVALGPAHREVDLVSPYFVPGAGGTAALASHAARGVQLRIVTNSLAATDVAAVHAGYSHRRADLLRAGVKLYEFKPGSERERGPGWWPGGSSAASLHGKTFSVDRKRVFVGSFNVDPRSVHLNTEMGLVVESPALASAIADGLDRQLPSQTFELRLGEGERLEWIERSETSETSEIVHLTEPRASLWRRLLVALLSVLPIEWLL